MIKSPVILLFVLLLSSCHFSNKQTPQEHDFYETIAGWDIKHVPIIPPFRATSTSPGQWQISGAGESLHLGNNRKGDIPVLAFGVSKQYIYGTIPKDHADELARCFLFNTQNLLYVEYDSVEELNKAFEHYLLDKKPIERCDTYFTELSENKRCYWYPEKGQDYPIYPAFRPDSCITITIKESSKGIHFQLPPVIKRSATKIYYFKTAYNRDTNDLYYISFDNSNPKLIKNGDTIAAYAENNRMLEITVYTPYPIAQSKGLSEKDRIVLTQEVALE